MKGAVEALRERVPLDPETLTELSSEPVPEHLKRWWWCLGGTPAYLLLVQVVTGILLTFYYVPEPGKAYESVRVITEEVSFGWWVRGIHSWGADFFIIAVVLHAMRVFFTGAYRRPRELNWVIGSFLLGISLVWGFTGYSLVYEQLSYWGATVAGNLTEAFPLVGPPLARFIRGGDVVSDNTLTRFFVFHIGVLPTIVFGLLFLHILLIRLHGVSELRFDETEQGPVRTFPFFPDHFLTEVGIGVALMTVLTCCACIWPAGLEEAANPLVTPEHIKPEWYFYFSFRWLKLMGLTWAVLTMSLVGFLFVSWPLWDALMRRFRPGTEASVVIGAVFFVAILVLTVWEATAGVG